MKKLFGKLFKREQSVKPPEVEPIPPAKPDEREESAVQEPKPDSHPEVERPKEEYRLELDTSDTNISLVDDVEQGEPVPIESAPATEQTLPEPVVPVDEDVTVEAEDSSTPISFLMTDEPSLPDEDDQEKDVLLMEEEAQPVSKTMIGTELVAEEDEEIMAETEDDESLPEGLDQSVPVKPFALNRLPIESREQDSLGMSVYAEALASYCLNSKTPLNVAIKGPSGCGKTSFMRLLKKELEKYAGCIRFDAGRYSALCNADQLGLIFIGRLIESIPEIAGQSRGGKLRQAVDEALGALKILEGGAWHEHSPSSEIPVYQEGLGQTSGSDPGAMDTINSRLREMLCEYKKISQTDKILILIDNLNNASADKFVKIRRVIDSFFAIPGLIFILETDDFDSLELTNFFQFSFQLPRTRSNVTSYLEDIVAQAGLLNDDVSAGLPNLRDIVLHSVGINPREIKHIVNRLNFVAAVLANEPTMVTFPFDEKNFSVLFSVLCLESAFPDFYSDLLCNCGDFEYVHSLFRKHLGVRETFFAGDNMSSGKIDALRLNGFMRCLHAVLHTGSGETLEIPEIELLRKSVELVSTASRQPAKLLADNSKEHVLMFFASQVKAKLSDLFYAPDGGDKSLRGNSTRQWIGLWYEDDANKQAWGMGSLYYFIEFNRQYFSEISIGMRFDSSRLNSSGIPDDKIHEMELLPFWAERGFKAVRNGTQVEISKILFELNALSATDLNPDEAERTFLEMRDLIEVTHSLFDKGPQVPKRLKTGKPKAEVRYLCPKCHVFALVETERDLDGSLRFQCRNCGQKAKQKG